MRAHLKGRNITSLCAIQTRFPSFIITESLTHHFVGRFAPARRLSDEFDTMQKENDESASQLSIPESSPPSSQLTQTMESLNPTQSEQNSQEKAKHQDPPHSARHPNLHNPHADEGEESNSSVLNSIFSPGLRSFVTSKFAALTNSLGVRSNEGSQEREGLNVSSTSIAGSQEAVAGGKSTSSNSQNSGSNNPLSSSSDSITKIRLPSANGIHHAAYRKRPNQGQGTSNATTPLSSVPPSPSHQPTSESSQADASHHGSALSGALIGNVAALPVSNENVAPSLSAIPEAEEKSIIEEVEAVNTEAQEVENIENEANLEIHLANADDDTEAFDYDEELEEVEGVEVVEEDVSEEEFDAYLFMANVPPRESIEVPALPPPGLPVKARGSPRVTLVLDLDETLVHCSLEKIDNPDLIFAVQFDDIEYQVYVRKRPGFEEFLSRVSELFEVAVFTASQRAYADKLLNILDPTKKWIHHRLFRESCICVQGNYLKDLTILNRELSKVAIVDNSPYVFAYQIDNGVPIESWYNDTRDRELLHLLPFLETLVNVPDVRPLIREKFQLAKRVEESLRTFQMGVANAQNQPYTPSPLPAHLIPDYETNDHLQDDTASTEREGALDAEDNEDQSGGRSHRSKAVKRTSNANSKKSTSRTGSRKTKGGEKNDESEVSDAESTRSQNKVGASVDNGKKNVKNTATKSGDDKSPSNNTSLIEGDDDDDEDERTVPAPTSRRKSRVRSRIALAQDEESDSDLDTNSRPASTTHSRQSSTNSLVSSRRIQSKRS